RPGRRQAADHIDGATTAGGTLRPSLNDAESASQRGLPGPQPGEAASWTAAERRLPRRNRRWAEDSRRSGFARTVCTWSDPHVGQADNSDRDEEREQQSGDAQRATLECLGQSYLCTGCLVVKPDNRPNRPIS